MSATVPECKRHRTLKSMKVTFCVLKVQKNVLTLLLFLWYVSVFFLLVSVSTVKPRGFFFACGMTTAYLVDL